MMANQTSHNPSKERRKHKRFPVTDNAFAVLRFSPASTKIGRIIDISLGGMAFEYENSDEWGDTPKELSILFGDDDFYLEKIQFETISDTIISFSFTETRRRGIKFGDLSASQKEQLNNFIDTFVHEHNQENSSN